MAIQAGQQCAAVPRRWLQHPDSLPCQHQERGGVLEFRAVLLDELMQTVASKRGIGETRIDLVNQNDVLRAGRAVRVFRGGAVVLERDDRLFLVVFLDREVASLESVE